MTTTTYTATFNNSTHMLPGDTEFGNDSLRALIVEVEAHLYRHIPEGSNRPHVRYFEDGEELSMDDVANAADGIEQGEIVEAAGL